MILYIYHIPKADSYMAHSRFPSERDSATSLSIIKQNMNSAPPFHPRLSILRVLSFRQSFDLLLVSFSLVLISIAYFFRYILLYKYQYFHLILSISLPLFLYQPSPSLLSSILLAPFLFSSINLCKLTLFLPIPFPIFI